MGVRAADDRTARDGGLLPAERRRLPEGRVRDPGTRAEERVSPSASCRLRARAARTASPPVPDRGSGPLRCGRRRALPAPAEDRRERPPPRMAVPREVAGRPRGGPPDRPIPDAARRRVISAGDRPHRRRRSHGERLMAHPSIAAFHPAGGPDGPEENPCRTRSGGDQAPKSPREARRPEPRGAAPPPGARSRPRDEATDRRDAPSTQGPPRLLCRRSSETPPEAGRAPREGEGPHRTETKTPRLRPRRCRPRAARPEEARLPAG